MKGDRGPDGLPVPLYLFLRNFLLIICLGENNIYRYKQHRERKENLVKFRRKDRKVSPECQEFVDRKGRLVAMDWMVKKEKLEDPVTLEMGSTEQRENLELPVLMVSLASREKRVTRECEDSQD